MSPTLSGLVLRLSSTTAGASDGASGEMMEEGSSVVLFVVLVAALAVGAAVLLPRMASRLPLRLAVPVLALVGPVLALAGGLIGVGTMTLSGRDVWYSLVVTLAGGLAAIVVGLRLAGPVARDLERVASTVASVALGDRSVRTGLKRSGEIGALAEAVDGLTESLAAAEARREAADAERNSVVDALSHDLRTPLASLLAGVDAIEDGVGDPESHLRAMRGNVLALERLVADLFLLARAEAGAMALSFEPLDLGELVDEAVEALGPVAGRRQVELSVDVAGLIQVDGDATALGRVLRNLLDNAVRHSPDGGLVEVEVAAAGPETPVPEIGTGTDGRATAWPRARVVVRDQGSGFDPGFVPRALERFSQADGARSRQGSAGLGLAIADALVTAHHGEVVIEPGPGGRVTVLLPTAPLAE